MIEFNKKRDRIVTDVLPISKEDFINILIINKPSKIFNSPYSTKIPCWVITEYLENNRIKYFANGWADKTPVEESIENVYDSWKSQGLTNSYFENEL